MEGGAFPDYGAVHFVRTYIYVHVLRIYVRVYVPSSIPHKIKQCVMMKMKEGTLKEILEIQSITPK